MVSSFLCDQFQLNYHSYKRKSCFESNSINIASIWISSKHLLRHFLIKVQVLFLPQDIIISIIDRFLATERKAG